MRPDGWGWRARVGAIIPHADVVPEGELNAMAPEGVSVHVARVPLTVRGATGDLDEPVAFTAIRGIDVVQSLSVDLPGGQRDMHPARLHEWLRAHVTPGGDAVFIGGNGFRAVGAIEALEEDLRLPVLTANQIVLWHALRSAGVRAKITGYGRVFDHEPANAPPRLGFLR